MSIVILVSSGTLVTFCSAGGTVERRELARKSWRKRTHAVMERFFSTLKTERCHRKRYATRQQARAGLFVYLARWYNPLRRPFTRRNTSPIKYQ